MTKSQRTREHLRSTAVGLFSQRGYEETSVALIAETAGVTEMTFFRHFASKDAVLIDDPFDPEIGAAISRQPEALSPFTRAARGIRSVWASLPVEVEEEIRSRLRIVAMTPTLRSGLAKNSSETEVVISAALEGDSTPHRTASVVAGAVMGALNSALLEWSLSEHEALGSAILDALDILETDRD
jgi:AcrR family transcriptional regulator